MTTVAPSFTAEQLATVLEILPGADSVELKLTVPESHQRSAVDALDIDPLDAQMRQVFFFDTPDLDLNRAGVVVRARRVQGKPSDSVIKLRPVDPADLPAELRAIPEVGVELDAMPGGFVCSASMKCTLGTTEVREVAKGERPLKQLFSKQQKAFFKAHVPEGIRLADLSILGPIVVFKLKFSPVGFGRKLVAELWMYPDNTRILEFSTKCAPAEMFQVAAEARAFLGTRGVDLSGEQQTKTATALAFFAENLKAAASA